MGRQQDGTLLRPTTANSAISELEEWELSVDQVPTSSNSAAAASTIFRPPGSRDGPRHYEPPWSPASDAARRAIPSLDDMGGEDIAHLENILEHADEINADEIKMDESAFGVRPDNPHDDVLGDTDETTLTPSEQRKRK